LIYLPDPVAALPQATTLPRPGSLICVVEEEKAYDREQSARPSFIEPSRTMHLCVGSHHCLAGLLSPAAVDASLRLRRPPQTGTNQPARSERENTAISDHQGRSLGIEPARIGLFFLRRAAKNKHVSAYCPRRA
jgi:hypothetical protein